MKLYIIGAGPGDPELLTVKAEKIIKKADVVIYAGSLINPAVLKLAKKDAIFYNSAEMSLEEIIAAIKKHKNKKIIARLHSGDPSIYGATAEQMRLLGKNNIDYEIIPGISSFLASAAALKKEYTIPELSQTIIITRFEGKTKVPEKETLASLAKHRASMVIFLSAPMIEKVAKELKEGYPENTPAAAVYRASWNDEKIIFGSLKDIAAKVKKEKIEKTALILVGDFLKPSRKRSKLYDKRFYHSFRKVLSEDAKKLPRFPDGRVDYSNSDKAPVLTCFVKYQNKLLLLKRSEKVGVYQGKWNTVAGYLDEPKPIYEKALEEVKEELGIAQKDVSAIKEGEPYEFKDDALQKTWIVHPVLVKLKHKPEITLDWEHTEYRWINPEELKKFDTVPKLDESLRRALASTSSASPNL